MRDETTQTGREDLGLRVTGGKDFWRVRFSWDRGLRICLDETSFQRKTDEEWLSYTDHSCRINTTSLSVESEALSMNGISGCFQDTFAAKVNKTSKSSDAVISAQIFKTSIQLFHFYLLFPLRVDLFIHSRQTQRYGCRF